MHPSNGFSCLAEILAFANDLTLVVLLAPASKRDFQLRTPPSKVALDDHGGHALRLDSASYFANLLGVQHELANTLFLVPEGCVGQNRDSHPLDPSLVTGIDIHPRIGQVCVSFTQHLHFAANQYQSGLERLLDLVVKTNPPIARDETLKAAF